MKMRLFRSEGAGSNGGLPSALLLTFLALLPLTGASPNPPHVQYPLLPPSLVDEPTNPQPVAEELAFKLRHVFHHGTFKYPNMLRRLDVKPDDKFWVESEGSEPEPVPVLKAKSRIRPIQRLANRDRKVVEEYMWASRHGWAQSYGADAWVMDEITHPNVTDKETVITLAKMSADAYVEVPDQEDWIDVGGHWNTSDDFGWDGDGLRGHVFIDDRNTTVIISVKGTSPAVFDGPDTTTNDKINDNLLFSCCCGKGSVWWKSVCDCYSGTAYTCGKTCLRNALLDESRYYTAGINLFHNVTRLYPQIRNIWIVGHSLGGAISSLVGLTYGLPVVTFEAPGEALAAGRLGLPVPPEGTFATENSGTYHFGHSADPIFMGTCNGYTAPCSLGGYAMETRCHSGHECLYDVVNDKGWRVGLGYHRIQLVIKDVLEAYGTVPECKADPSCVDCFNWKFEDSPNNGTTTKTTRTTKTKTTATTTCRTKGWWGCLDDTTTVTTTIEVPTLTTTDALTTTTEVTTTTSSTTCKTKGWWGCLDEPTDSNGVPVVTTTKALTTTTTSARTLTTTSTTTVTCTSYGWYGNCLDRKSTSTTSSTTVSTTPSTTVSIGPSATVSITNSTTVLTTPSTSVPTTMSTTCSSYVWYRGCLDEVTRSTITAPPTSTKTTTVPTSLTSTSSCHTRGWFGRCREYPDEPKTTSAVPTTTSGGSPEDGDGECDWFGIWC